MGGRERRERGGARRGEEEERWKPGKQNCKINQVLKELRRKGGFPTVVLAASRPLFFREGARRRGRKEKEA